ncbi:MAG: phosphoribosylglycinamide formyltransferase [Cyclobacteriaceae bacterium]|nr:phosphoribosylglycinamide formyltransferase [Cyclobacteriaceae bacterium]
MNQPARIAVFLSGNGSNAEKIFSYFKDHSSIKVGLVLSNNSGAQGLQRAIKFNIPTRIFTRNQFRESDEVLIWLKEAEITHIVLAGFLWMIPINLIKAFPNRIINIHPALLPKFGGKGMYGIKVHEAVKAANETQTGITLHEVNEKYDEGKIIFQTTCNVLPTDTPFLIAEKVQALEHTHYPPEIEKWVNQ